MITEQDDLYFGWRANLKKSTERMGQEIYLSLCKKVKDEMVSSVTVFGKISSIFGNYFSVYIAFGKFLAYLFLYVFWKLLIDNVHVQFGVCQARIG